MINGDNAINIRNIQILAKRTTTNATSGNIKSIANPELINITTNFCRIQIHGSKEEKLENNAIFAYKAANGPVIDQAFLIRVFNVGISDSCL
ncbi:hypothetical protein IJU97_02900 [bacterium]|nr:hypothetical protein [bacterium]